MEQAVIGNTCFHFMFVPCINSIEELFIFHNDAHNYKITGILKQLKFRRSLRHVSGTPAQEVGMLP
jgi:hypothetical protein